ncbi:eIF-2-alpha kinase activator GCN1 isoform X2 [Daktulosphaira vitifoliae]|uniref:eIF-2-alpha kinase activator GCN1 isoform X2 n=1 Tax=Daktulosphaira vitifoliae TaxID=58002 RepID=UPI0021A9C0DF|nr:eIF-2-alpha kinase activator GCN1 isoform X2 [Daktulosphaira vitifoliae]
MADLKGINKQFVDFHIKTLSASIKERKVLFKNASNITKSNVGDDIWLYIGESLLIALSRYQDLKSQSYVKEFMKTLMKSKSESCVINLTPLLIHYVKNFPQINISNNLAKTAYFGFEIISIIIKYSFKESFVKFKAELAQLIELQALLISAIAKSKNTHVCEKSYNILNDIWLCEKESLEYYGEVFKSLDSKPYLLVIESYVLKSISLYNISLAEKFMESFLNVFIKEGITCKIRPEREIIHQCSFTLKLVTIEIFKTKLLPSMLKAMLRNPEIILECISVIIANLSIDLSAHCSEIIKGYSANIYSQNEQARIESADICKELALKCSDASVVLNIVKDFFNIYNGSQGKLSTSEQKINVLQAIGNLSYNTVANDEKSQEIADYTIEQLIKILDTELHEKTLIQALHIVMLWSTCFKKNVPKLLINWFPKGYDKKSSVLAVKLAYIDCMAHIFKKNHSKFAVSIIPLLLKTVEKSSQSSQIPIATEFAYTSYFLLQLVKENPKLNEENGFSNFWSIILNTNKVLFLSEKLLLQFSEEVLNKICTFSLLVLNMHFDKINGPIELYLRSIVFSLLTMKSSIRAETKRNVTSIVLSPGGSKIAASLLIEIMNFLQNNIDIIITPKYLVEAISILCQIKNLTEDEQKNLAFECLKPSHHPIIKEYRPNLWLMILNHYQLKPSVFIRLYEKKLIKLFMEEYKPSRCMENVLSTISKMNGDIIIPSIIEKIRLCLVNNNSYINVTEEEYAIYLHPEGDLYNKSILANKENEDTINLKNMKRESKAYSFKEQQEEIMLRKEIEAKKIKEGKMKKPELSPKQKEAMDIELKKESEIRNTLNIMNNEIISVVSMLNGIIIGNPLLVSQSLQYLLPGIISNLQSLIAAPLLKKVFIDLAFCAFNADETKKTKNSPKINNGRIKLSHSFIQSIAYLTLRKLKPKCQIDKNWLEEDIEKASTRLVKMFCDLTRNKKQELTSPAFCYSFTLIRAVILDLPFDHPLVYDSLSLLQNQATIRPKAVSKAKSSSDLQRPKFLPRIQMFELLSEIISRTIGNLQDKAASAFLTIAKSCSTEEKCDPASREEILCLLSALQNPCTKVRYTAIQALKMVAAAFPTSKKDTYIILRITKRIWITKFDIYEENRNLADDLWDFAKLDIKVNGLLENLLEDVVHPVTDVQKAVSVALFSFLKDSPINATNIALKKLLSMYNSKVIKLEDNIELDDWQGRVGVAMALEQLSLLLSDDMVIQLVNFFVSTSLDDRNHVVREHMLKAAVAVVNLHGKNNVDRLMSIFEKFLKKATSSESFDNVRLGVVVCMGSLARHLDNNDPKLKPITNRLLEALSTPSQEVQEAVSNCLSPLMPMVKDDADAILKKLLNRLFNSASFGERKGAAHGLAGVIKGLGILSLKQYDIMSTLTEAIQDKKNYKKREGALFAFEMLCSTLGRLFEPYIVHVLPHLLSCFGDNSEYVRTATYDCSKAIMSKLSAHGVKLILPSLLNALEGDSWRTKTGSVELLGAMAYCAPKQLSSCLPSIVPKLIEVLSDSHISVQEAGAQALKVIGSVIRNPEIQAIVPVLLEALQNPSNKTAPCLQILLNTKFVHFIDAPSLALIMPVVQRAFIDRSTETRKMAAQIIGNMYSLTDQKDLTPYLPSIIPGLKNSLLDPVPEVRTVSARALGAMVRGMGETSFQDLLPWLMQTLTSEASSVDRSGAAQGLSEVVGGLGVSKLHSLMPEIIATAERTDIAPQVKDGYIMMFIYMPVVFNDDFIPYINQIITPILKALADENEFVRETALKAGQRIVNMYAESAIQLLLPELERGLFDDNWRIRFSSVQLLGDLLYRISGVSGKMSTETANDDDNFGTEHSHKAIIGTLGAERRNRVLAGLYMGRSDVALMVRQAALHVWKVVVTNTPRTLREILPTLFTLLLGCLASTSFDKRQVAARTLGDLVRKLGERVLPDIIPILEKGLESEQADQRQGVCIGLSEIMASTSRDMVLTFVDSLVPTVSRALMDPLPSVRQAAAKTFDSLHSTVGHRALDDILPPMLNNLNNPDPEIAEKTLDGLRQVMAVKSRVVLPYLIPQLTQPPINTKALSILASVAGEALNKYLHKILPALLTALSKTESATEELAYCQAVVLAVCDDAGTMVDLLLDATQSDNVSQKQSALQLLAAFCSHTKADYSSCVPKLLHGIIYQFKNKDEKNLHLAWEALNAVCKSVDTKQSNHLIFEIRQAIKFVMNDNKNLEYLPGFCIPKGADPFVPIFREAILNGNPEIKEQAAQGWGEVVKVAAKEGLTSPVLNMTGPLIRILNERYSWNIKSAILETVALLLAKTGSNLKQFLPQLQTTFLKSLQDPNRQVRLKAANALSHLIVVHSRTETIFVDLHSGVKNSEDPAIKETMLQALRGVISPAGDKMSDQVRRTVFMTLREGLGNPEDTIRSSTAGCLGALCKWLSPEQLNVALNDHILVDDASLDSILRHGRSSALFVALKESPDSIFSAQYTDKVLKTLLSHLQADKISITMNGVRSCGYLFLHLMKSNMTIPSQLLSPFVRLMNQTSNEVKQLVAHICLYLGKSEVTLSPEFLKLVLPMLVNGSKEKNCYVKSNSEIALIAVLKLQQGDATLQACLNLLDIGAREALNDVINKVLRKVSSLQIDSKVEELDDTLIT